MSFISTWKTKDVFKIKKFADKFFWNRNVDGKYSK